MAGHIRIGIDTGGTFTDVVAFDETTGELTVTKTPSTPADPTVGFMTGLTKVLGLAEAGPGEISTISHGTTIATNQLLEGNIGDLGFITSAGFEFMLEIARQSVPDGYGNSYFWVKPDRIVPPDLVKTTGGRMDHTGAEVRPFDEAQAVQVARWFRDRGVETLGVCFLHSYANAEHEERMAAVLAREHPKAVVSLSSQVLPEYREYERSMTTLVDAAVKPRVSRYLASIAERLELLANGGGGRRRQRGALSRQTETPGHHTRAACVFRQGSPSVSWKVLAPSQGETHTAITGRDQTVVTLTPASVRAVRMRGLAALSVISSVTVLISQIWAKATRPILELSATTTTEWERSIRARFVWASTSWWVVRPAWRETPSAPTNTMSRFRPARLASARGPTSS